MKLVERLRNVADTIQPEFGTIMADTVRAAIARIEAADVILRHKWIGTTGHEAPMRPQEMMVDCLALALLAETQDRALVREQDGGASERTLPE